MSDLEMCLSKFVNAKGGIGTPREADLLIRVMMPAEDIESRALCLEVLQRSVSSGSDGAKAFVSGGGLKVLRKWVLEASASEGEKESTELLVLLLKVARQLPVTYVSLKLSGAAKPIAQLKKRASSAAVRKLAEETKGRWATLAQATIGEQEALDKRRQERKEKDAKRRKEKEALEKFKQVAAGRKGSKSGSETTKGKDGDFASKREREKERRVMSGPGRAQGGADPTRKGKKATTIKLLDEKELVAVIKKGDDKSPAKERERESEEEVEVEAEVTVEAAADGTLLDAQTSAAGLATDDIDVDMFLDMGDMDAEARAGADKEVAGNGIGSPPPSASLPDPPQQQQQQQQHELVSQTRLPPPPPKQKLPPPPEALGLDKAGEAAAAGRSPMSKPHHEPPQQANRPAKRLKRSVSWADHHNQQLKHIREFETEEEGEGDEALPHPTHDHDRWKQLVRKERQDEKSKIDAAVGKEWRKPARLPDPVDDEGNSLLPVVESTELIRLAESTKGRLMTLFFSNADIPDTPGEPPREAVPFNHKPYPIPFEAFEVEPAQEELSRSTMQDLGPAHLQPPALHQQQQPPRLAPNDSRGPAPPPANPLDILDPAAKDAVNERADRDPAVMNALVTCFNRDGSVNETNLLAIAQLCQSTPPDMPVDISSLAGGAPVPQQQPQQQQQPPGSGYAPPQPPEQFISQIISQQRQHQDPAGQRQQQQPFGTPGQAQRFQPPQLPPELPDYESERPPPHDRDRDVDRLQGPGAAGPYGPQSQMPVGGRGERERNHRGGYGKEKRHCMFFNAQANHCKNGANCPFIHDRTWVPPPRDGPRRRGGGGPRRRVT
ncbi:unnamed protein product [Chrysoparadoxa australica]